MSLDNLVKTRQLQPHTAQPAAIQKLLPAARRNLSDAGNQSVSDETRFDAAYKAIMQCALIGVTANGYRPSSNVPGHHQTMIQTLSLTLGVPRDTWLVLDTLRRKRNLNDYSGDTMEPESVRECVAQAQALLAKTEAWLGEHRADLVEPTG